MKRNLEEQRKKMADKLQQLTSNSQKTVPAASPVIKAAVPLAVGAVTTPTGAVTTPAPFNIAALQASVQVHQALVVPGNLTCSLRFHFTLSLSHFLHHVSSRRALMR